MWLLVGVAAIIGHCFPVYLMTFGGKGIATSLGVFTAVMPLATLLCFVCGMTFLATTGYMAIASCLGIALLPLFGWLLHGDQSMVYVWVPLVLAVTLNLRHIGNYRRLVKGVEPKIWDRAKAKQRER